MRSDFRYCIRKFIEKLVYCEYSVANSCSIHLVVPKNAYNGPLKPGAGKWLRPLIMRSVSGRWQYNFMEVTEK